MVLHTCDRMAAGGIHDQLGGGFARYSVDAEWLVPHFEKMLYDNAQLAQLYLDAYLVSGEARHAEVARDILDYVLRDMTHPDGGFYSAEDADSEGHEGKFYCWTRAELAKLLTPEEFKVAARYFGITEQGNFLDHSHPQPLPNQNVLSIADPTLTGPESACWPRPKSKMLAARAERVPPAAGRQSAGLLERPDAWRDGAGGRGSGRSRVSRRRGEEPRLPPGQALGRQNQDPLAPLARRRARQRAVAGRLRLPAGGRDRSLRDHPRSRAPRFRHRSGRKHDSPGFTTPRTAASGKALPGAKDLILRVKEDYDGAEPSGNSVAILALLKLGRITDRKEFIQAAEQSLRLFANRLQQAPQAVPYMLQALDCSLEEPCRAVVAGDPGSPETRALLRAIHSVYQPNKVVLGNTGPVEPFARTLPARGVPWSICAPARPANRRPVTRRRLCANSWPHRPRSVPRGQFDPVELSPLWPEEKPSGRDTDFTDSHGLGPELRDHSCNPCWCARPSPPGVAPCLAPPSPEQVWRGGASSGNRQCPCVGDLAWSYRPHL